jgi:hypothetical protein
VREEFVNELVYVLQREPPVRRAPTHATVVVVQRLRERCA